MPGEVLPHVKPGYICHLRQNAREHHVIHVESGTIWCLGKKGGDCGRIGQVHGAMHIEGIFVLCVLIFRDEPGKDEIFGTKKLL